MNKRRMDEIKSVGDEHDQSDLEMKNEVISSFSSPAFVLCSLLCVAEGIYYHTGPFRNRCIRYFNFMMLIQTKLILSHFKPCLM